MWPTKTINPLITLTKHSFLAFMCGLFLAGCFDSGGGGGGGGSSTTDTPITPTATTGVVRSVILLDPSSLRLILV